MGEEWFGGNVTGTGLDLIQGILTFVLERRITKILNQDNLSQDRNLNPRPPE
jgi:hypothetical protein